MTVETHEVMHARDAWNTDDTIDLRQYLDVLIQWWREIVLITISSVVLAVLGILGMRMILPPHYQASADVAIVRRVSNVNFDERFQTTPEELGTNTANLSARRSALLGLVTTGTIAKEVISQLGAVLSPEEQIPANLLEMVTGEEAGGTQSDSDLIRITVTADDAEKAALIATTWAHTYVQQVNTIYGQVPDEVFHSIEKELTQARESYLASQATLEEFITTNRIDELTSRVAVLQQRVTQGVSLQQAFLLQWQKTQEQLTTARALRAQVAQGGDGAARSNMAALQVLKMSIYSQPPDDLQVEVRDIPEVTAAAMLTDIESLIASLEGQLQDLNTQIAAGSAEASATPDVEAQSLTMTLQALRMAKSQLETETSRQLQLVQQRDLNWETFKTLSSKMAELNLTRAAASSEVRFGAEAVPPASFEPRIRLSFGVLMAGGLGFGLALLVVFLASYLNYQPLLGKPRTTTT